MENTHCLVCSRKESSPFLTLSDRLTQSTEKFVLIQCMCGFVYLNPRPTVKEIYKYYKSEIYDPHVKYSTKAWDKLYKYVQQLTFRWKYNILNSFYNCGRLLDIGGGKGDFVKYIYEKEWDVTFQDSIVASKALNIKISFVAALSDLHLSERYDVITLWHSMEHIHDIQSLFDQISNLLNDSGLLMIAVPNLNAPERIYYGKNWAPYDVPRHLYHFQMSSLIELCEKYKFNVLRKYSMFQDTPYNILLSIPNLNPLHIFMGILIFIFSFIKKFLYEARYLITLHFI